MRRTFRAVGGVAIGALLAAVTLIPSAEASPQQVNLLGRYIVTLDDSVTDVEGVARQQLGSLGRLDQVFHHALNGYVASLSQAALALLLGDGRVVAIEPEITMRAFDTQTSPPYGLDRIDQRTRPVNGTYSYNTNGFGVRAYVIDSGVRRTHADFGGRVWSGYDAIDGGLVDDCNGHGTHVAGTLGGARWGVAKAVSIVAVRVLGCDGTGTNAQVIAGIDWVIADHQPSWPAVANLSFGGGASAAVDDAVRRMYNDGITVAVAAGNDNVSACNQSPGRVGEMLTVAAADQADARAPFSNRGPCVDLFAPGVGIVSAWASSDTASAALNGTSMSTPHVAGAAARYLQTNPGASPATVSAAIKNATTKDIVTNTARTCVLLIFCQPATDANDMLYVAP